MNKKYFGYIKIVFVIMLLFLTAEILNCQIIKSNKLVEESNKFNIYSMKNSDSSIWLVTNKGLIRYQNDSLNYYFIDTNESKIDLELNKIIYKGDKPLKQYEKLKEFGLYAQLLVSDKQVYFLYSNDKKNRLYITKIENEIVNTYKLDIDSSNRIISAIINDDNLYLIIKNIAQNKQEDISINLFRDLKLKKIISINKYPTILEMRIISYDNQFYMLSKNEIRNDSTLKFYFSIYKLTSNENILLKRYNDDSSDFMFWNYYQDNENICVLNYEGTLLKYNLNSNVDTVIYNQNLYDGYYSVLPFIFYKDNLYYYTQNFILNVLNFNNYKKKAVPLGNNKDCKYYVYNNYYLKGLYEIYCLCKLAYYDKNCKEPILKCIKLDN